MTVNLHHYDHDGRARFVTFCTHRKLPLLSCTLFKDLVVDTILTVCRETESRLLAYVVMPEHVHIVLVPPEAATLGPLVGRIKMLSAPGIIAELKLRKSRLLAQLEVVRDQEKRLALWQRRCYDHNCRTIESVWEKVNYCHNNPVKRHLSALPESYEWSSAKYYIDSVNTLLEIDVAASH